VEPYRLIKACQHGRPTKHRKEHKRTRDPFAIRVRVTRVAYLRSVIVIMSLETE